MEHVSVLKKVVQKYLDLKGGEKALDATLGLGGHSLDIVRKVGSEGKLFAFDQDERNLKEAQYRLRKYKDQITYIHDNFRYLKNRVPEEVDAILFDLGLSSPHVDDEDRGFSFAKEGPLDMRYDPRQKFTAYEVVNGYKEEELVKIFFEYGEERYARKIARAICQDRPFETTTELASLAERVLRPKRSSKKSKAHPATKIFQAIRIEVNDEFGALREALEGAMEILKLGGRIVVISYHSLEDRIVKKFFKSLERPEITDPQELMYRSYGDPLVEPLTKKPVTPEADELEENPRSRSAKLRAYKKIKNIPNS